MGARDLYAANMGAARHMARHSRGYSAASSTKSGCFFREVSSYHPTRLKPTVAQGLHCLLIGLGVCRDRGKTLTSASEHGVPTIYCSDGVVIGHYLLPGPPKAGAHCQTHA